MKRLLFTLLLFGVSVAVISISLGQGVRGIRVEPATQIHQPIRIEVPQNLIKNVTLMPTTGTQIVIRNDVSLLVTPPPAKVNRSADGDAIEASPTPKVPSRTP